MSEDNRVMGQKPKKMCLFLLFSCQNHCRRLESLEEEPAEATRKPDEEHEDERTAPTLRPRR